jgi:hypothetical protein
MTDPLRLVAIVLASLTVFAVSSLPTGSAAFVLCKTPQDCPGGFHCGGINPHAPGMCVPDSVAECSTAKPCPENQHCAGINPHAPGICVTNWPKDGLCSETKDCPDGFHCAGINPNAPGMCVADWAVGK